METRSLPARWMLTTVGRALIGLALWGVSGVASAQDCPTVPELTRRAAAAYSDAELEQSKTTLKQAYEALPCQAQVVDTGDLLKLFALDALVSLTQQDRKSAVYATIRMVTVDPDAQPGDELGPEIQELFASWASRLRESTVQITTSGTSQVFVDGRPVLAGQPLTVLAGEHILQVRAPDGTLSSQVADISTDRSILTGGEPVAPVEPATPVTPDKPAKEPKPAKDPKPEKEPRAPVAHAGEGRRAAMLSGGGALTVVGSAALAVAGLQERAFKGNTYTDATYAGCDITSACYAGARADRVVSDANRVRITYVVGYAAATVGVGLLGAELLLLPTPGGATATVQVRW